MRFFIIDSIAYTTMEKQIKNAHPDVIEVLPALMPSVMERILSCVKCPVIAGGLVTEKEDVMSLLEVGVSSISSTNQDVWFL
jgi:glycerol-3-phosphate responsive antiterminator